MTIDTSRISGAFEKKAMVWSDDRDRMSVELFLRGQVKPHVSFDPGGFISLEGTIGDGVRGRVEIINGHETPLKVIGVDNDLPDRVTWRLKEVKPGFIYGLEVEDVSKMGGNYIAHLTVRTDNAKKPTLTLIVRGEIKEQ
ncbi:MAG: hypothetical protein JRL30_25735 [Deltaproteobacteria bacterium]|nr:hypothetical protein [Deltaproteobacteria bacterium]